MRVSVNAKGQAESVEIVGATHAEFIRDARECARNSRYHPAQTPAGVAIAGITEAFPVHFTRQAEDF